MADGKQEIAHANAVAILEYWQAAVRPKSRLSVSEWAALHRNLPASSSTGGRWDNERTPYLVEIMDALSERNPARVVVCMAGAQVGKSESGYNAVGYWADECPANIILALPTERLYKTVSTTRISPLISLTETLRDKFDKLGTIDMKTFAGGAIHLVSAKSGPSLRSLPARYVIADECDAYPHDVAGEGDPLTLLRRRMATYEWQSKFLITSTPLLEGSSRVAAHMEETDYRKYHVECLACGYSQTIEWAQIKWDEGKPQTARFECVSCGHAHSESDKTALLSGGQWIASKEAANPNWVGFHLSALYSPHGWYSWRQAVEEFIASKNDEFKRQSWYNTVLGLPYKHYGYRPNLSLETFKPERYDADAPSEVLVLTAGIDVQIDRCELYVWGWANDEVPYLIDFQVLSGNLTRNEYWEELFNMLTTQCVYKTADGRELSVAAACVDTGGSYTTEVYRFVKNSHAAGYKRLYGIKGAPGSRDIIGQTPRLLNHRKQSVGNVELWVIGVDICKSTLYRKINKGMLHVPVALPNGELVEAEFYKQLTSETVQVSYKNGHAKQVWVLEGERNEALDCWVYAYAAVKALNVDWEYLMNNKSQSQP